jgi:hypothetical protein
MKITHLILILFIAVACGCDMKGDTDLNHDYGGGSGNGQQNGDNVIFSCNASSCFSGTQYCLKILSATGGATTASCLNYPSDTCKDRGCLSRAVREHYTACRDFIDFEQSQSRITLTCRNLR